MNIQVLNETHANQYHQLRLQALKVNPEAFGSTYEREIKFSLETVKERIVPSEEKFVLGAFDGEDALVGIVTFIRENSLKTAHKGNIFGMYVTPECRGQGVGKRLILDLITRARNFEGLEQINLTVVSTNLSAKNLYESIGFRSYGVERNALKFNGQYDDEDLMVIYL
jgi:RimJ/RimL family protein N-acetyltransferase